jgi:hypothetical protein
MDLHDISQVHLLLKKVCRANCPSKANHVPGDHILALEEGTFYAFDHQCERKDELRDRIFFYCYLSSDSNYISFGFTSSEKQLFHRSRSIITEENVYFFLDGHYSRGSSRSITILNGKAEIGKEKDLEIDKLTSDIGEYQAMLPFKINFDEKTKVFSIDF